MQNLTLFDKNLILVADDDKDFVKDVVRELGAEMPDAKFLKAYDGNQCLVMYEEHDPKPAVIILDLMMPKASGFLVLEKIRKTVHPNDLPVIIMVTANVGTRHKAYAETLGVFRYLIKPFQMQTLFTAVQEAKGKIF